jgi:biopolymer transport protein ExbD
MSMNMGNASGEPEMMVEMNTTPLIDVMLVLLVMLIITIPIQLHAVNMNMPVGAPPPKVKEPVVVKIDILPADAVLWNGVAVTSRDDLEQHLKDASTLADQPEIHLRPAKASKYDTVAFVLAASQRYGLSKLGIVGNEQFAN